MSKLNPISEERKHEIKMNIIKELKALIFPTVMLLIFAGLIIFIMNYQNKETEADIVEVRAYAGDDKPIVLENKYLKFEMNPTLTTFDVTVKSSGKVWHSVPEGGADDPIAIMEEKNKLQSTLLLTYGTDAGLDTTYDSYSLSVLNGIYEITKGEDFVQVDYSIGKVAKEFVIPPVCKADRLDELCSNMSVSDKENVKQFYKKLDINKLSAADKKNKDTLLESYPILETEVIYVLRDGQKDSAKANLQKVFEAAGYTYEEYLEDKELDTREATNSNPVFNVSVIYRLEDDNLKVEVPLSSLESITEYPITAISVLPYFGAGNNESEGYMVVPEGGGSIINFNNGKAAQAVYYSNLYGWDMAIERKDVVHTTIANMNVFGISDNKDSFICVVDGGAPYAAIRADISGRTCNFNYVNSVFTIKSREKFDLGANANQDVYVYLENLPDETLSQTYSFVDSGSYVDMAKNYRDYLLLKYPDQMTKVSDETTPVSVEIVGAVDKVKQIVGIPVSRPLPLTTYDEATDLISQITADGVSNLSVKYTGWCNGGVKQKYLKNIKKVSALGSYSDLKALSAKADELGVDLYLDGMVEYEKDSNLFNGFFSYRDAAKFLSRKRAELYEYSAVTYTAREGLDSYFLLHGDIIPELMGNLSKAATKYGANVSFQDVGKDLSSDYWRKKYTSRQKAMEDQVAKLTEISNTDQKIMINSGNAYAMPYADFITSMDLKGSEYTILDGCIPFYQIAIHGYKDYTGEPINVCGNQEEELLTCAEYGAGLNFTFMKESSFTLQKTLYSKYYGSDFDEWEEEFKSIYSRYNSEMGHVFNQTIKNHIMINNDVRATIYEDGTTVYVNYGYEAFNYKGVKIPARDYLVVR